MKRAEPRKATGFTLLEVIVTITVMVILVLLSLGALEGMRSRIGTRQFAAELSTAFAQASARADSIQGPVWMIVYTAGTNAPATLGGVLLYEDPDGDFNFNAFTVNGGLPVVEVGDRVEVVAWLNQRGFRGNVSLTHGGTNYALTAPFTGTTVSNGCSFCTVHTDGNRGAVVFMPGGEVRFVGGDGTPSAAGTGYLALAKGPAVPANRYAIAIAASTGYVRVVSR